MKDKRKLILRIAEKIISKKGYSETTIDEITKRAKIGKGTFYLYFKNKEELFFSIINENLENLVEKIKREVEKIEDFFEKLKKGIEIYLLYHEKNYYLFKILIQEKPLLKSKKFEDLWKEFFEKWDFIKRSFEKQIKKGEIKNFEVNDIICSLIGILHGHIHNWILSGRKYNLCEKRDIIYEIITNGIRR